MYLGRTQQQSNVIVPADRNGIGEIGYAVSEMIRGFFDSIQILVIFLAFLVVIYLWVLSLHQVDGFSMMPSYEHGQYMFVDKLFSKMSQFKRGDVIVFKYDDTKDFIKRVIGLPGDQVMIKDGQVYVNGKVLIEEYLPSGRETHPTNLNVMQDGETKIVPEGSYFLLGDNRDVSRDSRSIGFVNPIDHEIRGRVIMIVWPFDHFQLIKQINYNN